MKNKYMLIVFFLSVSISSDVNEELLRSVYSGNLESVVSTLKNSANFNLKDNHNRPLLSIAVEKGNIDIVRVLLEKGAKVNAVEINKDIPGWTPLMHAAESGNFEIVQLLLKYGANKKQKNGKGYDALYLAELWGHNEVASLLKGENIKGKKEYLCEKILSQKEIR